MALTKTRYSMLESSPVNVTDFGASTSASADDNATAFLAAKAKAGTYTINGQTVDTPVYIPAGTYAVTGTVVGSFFTDGIVGITTGAVEFILQTGSGPSLTNTVFGQGAMSSATPTGGDAGTANSAFGLQSLRYNTTGYRNTGCGYGALRNNVAAYANTGIGALAGYSLSAASATGNTAVGSRALSASEDGYFNTAIGSDALTSNLAGYQNTASGKNALYSNTTGDNNSAHGMNALYTSISANNNTASGAYSQHLSTTGYANTSSGFESLRTNITGKDSVAVGAQSLYAATNSYNTALGRSSGYGVTTGEGNLILGTLTNAGANSPVFSVTSEDNRVVVGSSAVTNAYVKVAWTIVSDSRDKTDIESIPYGLDFINSLDPVKFKRDDRTNYEDYTPDGSLKDSKYTMGFLAQSVITSEKAYGATDDTLMIADNEDPNNLKIVETALIPALVNAIKELKAEFDTYKETHP